MVNSPAPVLLTHEDETVTLASRPAVAWTSWSTLVSYQEIRGTAATYGSFAMDGRISMELPADTLGKETGIGIN
jgi:hypothetical protein